MPYAALMASTTETTQSEPEARGWIFVALAIWNLLLAIPLPIQAHVLVAREGFYYRLIWYSLPTEMIGLYPHLGYLLASPFSYHPWDASGTRGILGPLIVSFSASLALALYSRRRWGASSQPLSRCWWLQRSFSESIF
jgi:hypothetical protein